MRITPSQGSMLFFCGKEYPRFPKGTLEERIARGHELLMRYSDEDLGSDLIAWHEFLIDCDTGGYKWGDGHISVKKEIDIALKNADWIKAAKNVFT